MKFIETRGNDGVRDLEVTFSQAVLNPMASFGGLYSPKSLPNLGIDFLTKHKNSSYKTLALDILKEFNVDIEQSVLEEAVALYDEFDDKFNPVPVVKLYDDLFISELYHGPTRAFKDMALQPFGVVLSSLAQARDERYLILAATSGDTGPAALDTFRDRDNVQVVCLYPEGGTSDVQRLQMVTESAANLKVLGIKGDFDDAQSALKNLLTSVDFRETLSRQGVSVSAANSVNFGRIIFQTIYHLHSYLELVRQGEIALGDKVYLDVPSGNFGNALGGYYAYKMGLPVEQILIASNSNDVLTKFINEGIYDLRSREVIPTSSPAMDILKSSNIERILFDMFGAERTKELMTQLDSENFYQLTDGEAAQVKAIFAADFCSDAEGQEYIKQAYAKGYLMDTHTATCLKVYETSRSKPLKTIAYSTAEWTKFSPAIAATLFNKAGLKDLDALDLIAKEVKVELPQQITVLLDKAEEQDTVIDKNLIEAEILDFFNK